MPTTTLKNAYLEQLPAVSAALYTVPANTKARIVKATVCNDTTTVPTYTFWKVPSGSAADATTLVVNERNLPAKDSLQVDELVGQVLEAGDALHGVASSASQVTAIIDIVEIVETT